MEPKTQFESPSDGIKIWLPVWLRWSGFEQTPGDVKMRGGWTIIAPNFHGPNCPTAQIVQRRNKKARGF